MELILRAGRKDRILFLVVAFLVAFQISILKYSDAEFSPAFLLAPVVAYTFFRRPKDALHIAFFASIFGGVFSIIVSNLVDPGMFYLNTVNFIFGMIFAPSFIFLGQYLAERGGYRSVLFWMAVFSSILLILFAMRNVLLDIPVRAVKESGGPGLLDARILGIPVYFARGINAAAALFAFQAGIISAAIPLASRPWRAFLALGLLAAAYLVFASESRAAILALLLLVPAMAWTAFRLQNQGPRGRNLAVWSLAAVLMVLLLASASTRISELFDGLRTVIGSTTQPSEPLSLFGQLDRLSTGRVQLWWAALQEFAHRPLTGTGFAAFGRFGDVDLSEEAMLNTTAHLYYLNILWKGGLLFAVPFFVFIYIALSRAWRARPRPLTATWVFTTTTILMAFTFPSLFYDILAVPGAGLLAWFTLGLICVQPGPSAKNQDSAADLEQEEISLKRIRR